MTTLEELQADLDQLGDELDVIAGNVQRSRYEADSHALWDIMHRLRHLLEDRDLAVPPTLSEVIAHVKAGGKVKRCSIANGWELSNTSLDWWRQLLDRRGDVVAHGYRLIPIPEPTTERVRLDQALGRYVTRNGHARQIEGVDRVRGYRIVGQGHWHKPAVDSTVEVLRADR